MAIDVSSTVGRSYYTANGATTLFAVPFVFYANADLLVYVDNALKTITTDYTVTGAGVGGGGNVTFLVAPANLAAVAIIRSATIQRSTHFATSGPFNTETLNRQINEVTIWSQENRDKLARSLRQPDSDAAAIGVIPIKSDRASKVLAFDANGDPVPQSLALLGAIALPLTLADGGTGGTTAATARAALGAQADLGYTAADAATAAFLGVPQAFTAPQRPQATETANKTGTVTPDFTTYQDFNWTLTAAIAIANPTIAAAVVGQRGRIRIAHAGYTLTSIGTNFKRVFSTGAPTLSTTTGVVCIIDYHIVSTTRIEYTYGEAEA
jgi:hypothetical protein